MHCKFIRQKFNETSNLTEINLSFKMYIQKAIVDVGGFRAGTHKQYSYTEQQHVAEFIMHLCDKSNILHNLLNHKLNAIWKCPNYNETSF